MKLPPAAQFINLFTSFNYCQIHHRRKNKSGSSTKKPSRPPSAGLSSKTQEFEILCHICRRVSSTAFWPSCDLHFTKFPAIESLPGDSNLGCIHTLSSLRFLLTREALPWRYHYREDFSAACRQVPLQEHSQWVLPDHLRLTEKTVTWNLRIVFNL